MLPNYLTEFLPSLLLRLLAALLPVLVALTSLAELHWTRSAENRSMMIKTFMLLLFMVLILPTLGLTSINAVFQWLNKNELSFKWRCVSDNGAFFLKYVTTCSLIGTALDLLRLPELLWYLIKLLWSRSLSERLAVRMVKYLQTIYDKNLLNHLKYVIYIYSKQHSSTTTAFNTHGY
jgi:calcium permeable stress-gated cation channel